MELLNLRNASLKYKKPIEIETALAWNAVKKFLEQESREELFEYISWVKVTEKNISIVVRESLAKNELALYKESLGKFILEKLSDSYDSHERTIKIL